MPNSFVRTSKWIIHLFFFTFAIIIRYCLLFKTIIYPFLRYWPQGWVIFSSFKSPRNIWILMVFKPDLASAHSPDTLGASHFLESLEASLKWGSTHIHILQTTAALYFQKVSLINWGSLKLIRNWQMTIAVFQEQYRNSAAGPGTQRPGGALPGAAASKGETICCLLLMQIQPNHHRTKANQAKPGLFVEHLYPRVSKSAKPPHSTVWV